MAHRIVFESKDKVPEELKSFVKEVSGEDGSTRYEVSVVPKAKIDEFRERNIELAKKLESLEGTHSVFSQVLEDYDGDVEKFMEAYRELVDLKQKVEDGKLEASGKLEEEVKKRTAQMQSRYERKIKELTENLNQLKRALEERDNKIKHMRLESEVQRIVSDPKLGINPMAFKAVMAEIQQVFKVTDDGKIIPYDEEGNIIWGSDGTEPMSLREWVEQELPNRAPYVFGNASGVGTNGSEKSKGPKISEEDLRKMSATELWQLAAKASG